jgi:hypothetical protein
MMATPEFYAEMDPGIRFAVKVLHAHGLETSQSCEGGKGHAYTHPTVDLLGSAHDLPAFAALHYLENYGLEVRAVSQVWNVERGRIYEVVWRVELRHPYPERADEDPVFVWMAHAAPGAERAERHLPPIFGRMERMRA